MIYDRKESESISETVWYVCRDWAIRRQTSNDDDDDELMMMMNNFY